MKKLFWAALCCTMILVIGCNKGGHPYEGTFTTKSGLKITLNPDSSSIVSFTDDTLTYKGVWKLRKKGGREYVNIEFGGDYNYFWLRDGKLYRKESQMLERKAGQEVTYE